MAKNCEAWRKAEKKSGNRVCGIGAVQKRSNGRFEAPKWLCAAPALPANVPPRYDNDIMKTVANPELITIKDPAGFRVIELEGLVRMKLTSHRDKDRMHIRDLIAVGLLDAAWLPRLPPELAARLKQILDTPEG